MIHVTCALHCEAKPLIEHYNLKRRDAEDIFPIYIDRQLTLSLTVTGIGKVNAAVATMYTHGSLNGSKSDAWLNVGIAAHETFPIGQAIMAHCICDVSNKKTWYPQFVFDPPCQSATLLTLETPSTAYLDKLFDMEAAGFYETACRFATSELIHVIKVISDNRDKPAAGRMSEKLVEQLISARLETLGQVITSLKELSSELAAVNTAPRYYSECLATWHMTQYQKKALYRLLQRWVVLCPDISPITLFSPIKEGRMLLKSIQQHLDELPVSFVDKTI